MTKRFLALFLLTFALSSCANSKPAAEKVDPCREVMRITGKMNDQLMKALENDNYYMNYGIYANGLLVETCSKRYLKELSNMTLIE